jgi:hypothetical protein
MPANIAIFGALSHSRRVFHKSLTLSGGEAGWR